MNRSSNNLAYKYIIEYLLSIHYKKLNILSYDE